MSSPQSPGWHVDHSIETVTYNIPGGGAEPRVAGPRDGRGCGGRRRRRGRISVPDEVNDGDAK